MPQFDFYSFSTQVFYILLFFVIFHFLILNYVTTTFSQVLKLREKLFNTFLTKKTTAKSSKKTIYDSLIFLFFKNL